MIFATVGTQLPFDRMLSSLDNWAMHNPDVPVFAQTGASAREFPNLQTVSQLSQPDFRANVRKARLVVSHAGMGTILSAAELNKRTILMPRRAEFNEHRNDHQLDTALEMARLSNVTVADDSEELHSALDYAVSRSFGDAMPLRAPKASILSPNLDTLRDFAWMESKAARYSISAARKKVA